jgi:hypothetical protein
VIVILDSLHIKYGSKGNQDAGDMSNMLNLECIFSLVSWLWL